MADRLIDLLDTARHKYQVYEAEKDHRMRTAKTEAEFEAEASTYEVRHSFYARELRNNGVEIPVHCCDCRFCDVYQHSADSEVLLFCGCRGGQTVDPTDFCSYGERKGDGNA